MAAAAPSLTINADALATNRSPVITGTTNLPAGAPIVVSIDPDNDPGTANSVSYAATARSDGTWSVDTAAATPATGSLPAEGLTPWARITATATNAYGNSTTVTALDIPAVTPKLSNSSTATVSGTWTNLPGDTLSVLIDGTTYSVGNGNLSIAGNTWSLTTVPLLDGTYHVTATVSRSGPDSRTDLSTQELIIDTTGTVDITGGPSILTGDSTPVISGSTNGMPAGTLLTLEVDSNNDGSYDLTYQTTIAPDGSWTVDTGSLAPTSGALPEGGLGGITPVRATATDPAGNQGVDIQTLNIDRTPPEIAFTSGNRTPSDQPVITGTTDLAAGSTLTLEIDPDNTPGGPIYVYTAIVQPDGTWRVDTANPGANGGTGPAQSYPPGSTLGLVATATDPAGNSASATRPLIIDSSAPTVTVSEPLDWNGTPDGNLDATEDDTVVLRGLTTGLADGKTLSIAITDGVTTLYDTATVSGNSWTLASLNLSSLAAGPLTVTATHTDDGGNTYADTATINHVRNAVVSIDAISEDTGEVADFITRDESVSVLGTSTPGATVNVLIKDASDIIVASFSVPASGTGAWTTPAIGLLPGTYTVDAEVGGQHALRSMTIVAPTPPLLTASSPADNATGVAVDANLSLSFDRNVRPGSGIISLYRASDDSLVESYNVSTGLGSLTDGNGASLGRIAFSGNSLTLNPGTDLDADTRYYIRVDASAVIDQAGNAYAGIADSTTVDFRTAGGANQAPVLTLSGGTTSFTEGADTASTPVVIDAGLSVSDGDSPTLASATVSLTGNFQSAQDVLAFTNDGSTMGNITASYNSGTGVLTLTSSGATATLAQWQAALRSVTYDNTAGSPSTATRTVSFQVNDGSTSSIPASRALSVTVSPPLPVAPQITGPSGGLGAASSATAIPENTLPVATFSATENVTWSLAGSDASRFVIDASGALRFAAAPDFEAPLDVGDGAANNTYVIEVQATDGDGNTATQTVTVSVTDVQEATAPTQTVVIDRMDKDSGTSDSDFVTADGSAGRSIAGRLSAPLGPDEVVELSFDGGQTWTLATVTGTTWTATDPNAHADSWTLQARVSNPGANLSGPVSNRSVTLDTTPPVAPSVDPVSTTLVTPTLTGTAQVGPGERLSVSIDGRTYTDGDGHLSISGGRWALQLPIDAPLTPGVHSVEARITDLAGNSSVDTSRDELVITDVPPPRPPQPAPEPQPIVAAPPLPPPPSPSLTPIVTPPAAPAVLAAQDPVRHDPIGDQQLSNLRQLADDAQGDFGIRTRSEGFPIVVLRSDGNSSGSGATGGASLLVNRGIPDALIQERGRPFEVLIPNDAFAHSRQDAIISLTVTRSNGAALPGWLQFDPRTGIFRGSPPAGFRGDVEIRVIARDQNGNQVNVTFRIRVGGDGRLIRSASFAPAGDTADGAVRPGFSAQLKQAGLGGQSTERDRLVAQARALAARKATLPG